MSLLYLILFSFILFVLVLNKYKPIGAASMVYLKNATLLSSTGFKCPKNGMFKSYVLILFVSKSYVFIKAVCSYFRLSIYHNLPSEKYNSSFG